MTGNLKENSWFCHERKILENCHDRPSHSDTTNTHHPARRQGDTTASRPSTGACPPHHTHNGAQPNSLTSARAAIACRQQPPRCPSLSRLSCSVTMCRVTLLCFAVVCRRFGVRATRAYMYMYPARIPGPRRVFEKKSLAARERIDK